MRSVPHVFCRSTGCIQISNVLYRRRIADKIGITENTVRARVNKLIEDGVLQISGLVNPQFIPEMQVVVMGVKLSTLDLEEKAKEMLRLKGVISVMVVTGRYDLIVQAYGEWAWRT